MQSRVLFQMPRWDRRLRIVLDWTVALFFRPDITRVDLRVEREQLKQHSWTYGLRTQGSGCPLRLEPSIAPWYRLRITRPGVNDPLQRSRLKRQFVFGLGIRHASHLSPVVHRIRTIRPQDILN
jgi:hypothetical protein